MFASIFASRLALSQFVALLFAVAGMFGFLPDGLAQEPVVIAILFGYALVTTIGRFGVAGPIGELDTALGAKEWWQSKTIWTQVVGAFAAIGVALGVVPAGVDEVTILSAVMALVSLATIVFRPTARAIA